MKNPNLEINSNMMEFFDVDICSLSHGYYGSSCSLILSIPVSQLLPSLQGEVNEDLEQNIMGLCIENCIWKMVIIILLFIYLSFFDIYIYMY